MIRKRSRINILLAGIVLSLPVLAIVAHSQFGDSGLSILSVVISGALSAGLVVLYNQQTSILDEQHDLRVQELDREIRLSHSETLRKRIELWHGNPSCESKSDAFDQSDSNLPSVGPAEFRTAPHDSVGSDREKPFRVIPGILEGDRYLEDFLQNHAQDLDDTVDDIQQLDSVVDTRREVFAENFDAPSQIEKDKYSIKPTERLSEWVFDLLIRWERGQKDNYDDFFEFATDEFHYSVPVMNQDVGIWLKISTANKGRFAIFGAHWKTTDSETLAEAKEEVEMALKGTVEDVLDEVENGRPYQEAQRAAEALEEGIDAINRLDHLLVEYHGRPLYSGECRYLRESMVDP